MIWIVISFINCDVNKWYTKYKISIPCSKLLLPLKALKGEGKWSAVANAPFFGEDSVIDRKWSTMSRDARYEFLVESAKKK